MVIMHLAGWPAAALNAPRTRNPDSGLQAEVDDFDGAVIATAYDLRGHGVPAHFEDPAVAFIPTYHGSILQWGGGGMQGHKDTRAQGVRDIGAASWDRMSGRMGAVLGVPRAHPGPCQRITRRQAHPLATPPHMGHAGAEPCCLGCEAGVTRCCTLLHPNHFKHMPPPPPPCPGALDRARDQKGIGPDSGWGT